MDTPPWFVCARVCGRRDSLALTLNICWVIHSAADVKWHQSTSAEVQAIPATCPSQGPSSTTQNPFSDDCVIFPFSPPWLVHKSDIQIFFPQFCTREAADAWPWGDLDMANTMKLKNLGKKKISSQPHFILLCHGKINTMLKMCYAVCILSLTSNIVKKINALTKIQWTLNM